MAYPITEFLPDPFLLLWGKYGGMLQVKAGNDLGLHLIHMLSPFSAAPGRFKSQFR